MLSEDLLSLLVCPECRKELIYDRQAETLKCGSCRRVYPIRDGLPVLLKDQASKEE
ncbi:MAG: tetraacyldisaccharide 4'-kinase [Acidobacteria bacterium]|nr:MAG: tetraacyldisaccharide 4'-kinase [Acidobacteriota bacterium]